MSKDLFKGNDGGSDGFFKTFKTHFTQQDLNDMAAYSYFVKMNATRPPKKYFKPDGICIGELSDGTLLYLPLDQIERHMSVSGKTRSGKTTLLMRIFLHLFALANCVLVVMDKGDLVSQILDRVDTRLDEIIYVRCSDTDYPASINLLQLANFRPEIVIGEIVRILNCTATDRLSDRMVMLLRRSILALLCLPNSTLADVEKLLFDEIFRNRVLSKVSDPDLVYFFRRYSRKEKLFTSSAEGIVTRLEPFVADPVARHLLCQEKTNIPFLELAKGRRKLALLIDLNTDGITPMVADLISRVFLVIIYGLCLSRPFQDATPTYLILDECQTYCQPAILSEVLSRGAKWHTHMICSFQYLDQLQSLWPAVEGNAGSLISFTSGAGDAARLSKSFPGTNASEFVNLPRFKTLIRLNDQDGTFAFKAGTLPLPYAGRSYRDQIVELSRQKYAKPRAEVEAEFQKRRELIVNQNSVKDESARPFVENFEPLI